MRASLREITSDHEQEAPLLEMAERSTQETDCQGRAYFGDIYIQQGSGKASSSGMELFLDFKADLPDRYVLAGCKYQHLGRLWCLPETYKVEQLN